VDLSETLRQAKHTRTHPHAHTHRYGVQQLRMCTCWCTRRCYVLWIRWPCTRTVRTLRVTASMERIVRATTENTVHAFVYPPRSIANTISTIRFGVLA